ncbi:MAG: hypothetical protein V9F04_09490 [Dermatophilaceae bacterium]
MGVAVRAYYRTPRARTTTSNPTLSCGRPTRPAKRMLMPGYGWLFRLEDGRTNVGLGILDTSSAFGKTDYKRRHAPLGREHLRRPGTSNSTSQAGPIRGAALPMGFNRTPVYADGLLLVGDAAGMVNPFNGEGIDYALEAGRVSRRRHRAGARGARADDAPGASAHGIPEDHQGRAGRLLHARARGSPAPSATPRSCAWRRSTDCPAPRSCRSCSRSWPTCPRPTAGGPTTGSSEPSRGSCRTPDHHVAHHTFGAVPCPRDTALAGPPRMGCGVLARPSK